MAFLIKLLLLLTLPEFLKPKSWHSQEQVRGLFRGSFCFCSRAKAEIEEEYIKWNQPTYKLRPYKSSFPVMEPLIFERYVFDVLAFKFLVHLLEKQCYKVCTSCLSSVWGNSNNIHFWRLSTKILAWDSIFHF